MVGSYTTSSRLWRAQLTGSSITQVTLCVPAALVPAGFVQPQLIAAGDAGLSSTVSLTPLGTLQTGVCPDVQGASAKVDGYVLTMPTSSLAPSSGVGFFSLTAPYQLTVNKQIAGAGRVNAADQFSTQIRTGGAAGAVVSSDTASPGGGASTTGGSTTATATAPFTSALAATTYTLTESNAGPTPLSAYASSILCSNTAAGSSTVIPTTATPFATATGLAITPQAGDAITCTITNTPHPTLTLAKAWVNGFSTDAISVSTTGGSNNASISHASTGGAGGNTTGGGTAVVVHVGDVVTLPIETFTSGSAANYTSTVSCNNSTSPLTSATLPAQFTVSASDTALTCTYTNTRKSATLTLAKAWVNGKSGDSISVSTSGGSSNASISNASTGGAGGNTTGGGTAVTVYAGEVLSLPVETFTSGSGANYSSTVSCNNSTGTLSNATLPASFTVSPSDTAVTCTYSNQRKSATLTLAKTWVNGLVTDAISVSTTGGSNNASLSSASTGGAGGNTTAGGTPVTVYAGEVISLPVETFTSGASVNYMARVSCNNSASPLSNATLPASFTVAASDTAVLCTYSNNRTGASLTLAQAWVNGKSGDAVSVTTTGGTANATISNTGAGGSGSGNTTAGGTPVTVQLNDVITLPAQTFTPPGAAANYTSTVSCNNSATPVSNATLPASFTVSAADTAITCTYTNTRKSATLTLSKVWAAGAVAGNATTLSTTGLVNNASTGASVANPAGNTTTGSAATVFAGETATFPAETLSVGQASHYSTLLACSGATASLSGSNGQASNTLVLAAADAGQAISCSYTNTRVTPPGLDGLAEPAMWVKADALSASLANGAPLTAWPNSGAGASYANDPAHSATDPSFANATDSQLNFNPTVRFGGAGNLIAPSLLGSNAFTKAHVFAVVKPGAATQSSLFHEGAMGAGGSLNIHLPYNDGNVYWDAGSISLAQRMNFTPPAASLSSHNLWSFYGDNADTAAFSAPQAIRINAATAATDASAVVDITGNSSASYLGDLPGFTQYQADIAEFALYLGDSLNAAAYNRIESYLALKYGLTQNPGAATSYTASSGATLWTGQTTYQHNIAGLSMQSANGLNQTLSRSSNTAQPQLSIAHGATFPAAATLSGQSGAALSTSDDAFVWGDNDQTATSTGLIGSYTTSSRVWRAQRTGSSIAQVTLCVPAALVPSGFAQPQLIAAADAALSSNVSLTPLGALQTAACPGVQGASAKVDGYVVTVNTSSLAPASGVGFFTLTAQYQLSVNKQIAGAGRVNAADQFTTQIRTGGAAGAVVSSDTASPGGGATTSGVSTTATATAPFTSSAATTYTLTESNAGPTPLSAYVSSILCSNTAAGSSTAIPTTATPFATATGLNITPQASDAITCTITNAPGFTVGGSIVGASGNVTLALSDGQSTTNGVGGFAFANRLLAGTAYAVSVTASPAGQTCTVSNGSGTIGTADVSNVVVNCAATSGGLFNLHVSLGTHVGGTVLVSTNTGASNSPLSFTGSGTQTFTPTVANGTAYAITVAAPVGQTCSVINGSGTVAGADVTVRIDCGLTASQLFTVGGSIVGATGNVALALSDGQTFIGGAGLFSFANKLVTGAPYAVTVTTPPAGQTCTVANGSGTVASADVSNVVVTCAATSGGLFNLRVNLATHVGGTVLVSTNTGAANSPLSFTGTGTQTFTPAAANGTAYAITVAAPVGQTCSVINGTGTINGADVTVRIDCGLTASQLFTVGGSIVGASGNVTLALSDGQTFIGGAGLFSFANKLVHGSPYAVTVTTPPAGQTCTVANGSGTVGASDVSNVVVTCAATSGGLFNLRVNLATFVSGTVLVSTNTGAANSPLSFTGSGTQTFTPAVANGTAYAVTVAAPVGQTCSVINSAGTINGADITVRIDCGLTASQLFTVGGSIVGASGNVTLALSDGQTFIGGAGLFSFANKLVTGSPYAVTVTTPPAGQTCTVANGSGTVGASDVSNVVVTCAATSGGLFNLRVNLATFVSGTVLVSTNTGAANSPLSFTGIGTQTFTPAVANGTAYAVTAIAPAGQTCTVTSGSGSIHGADATARVDCGLTATQAFRVRATIVGANGNLTLNLNDGQSLTGGAGGVSFASQVASGTPYVITVTGAPPGQTCTVSNGSGSVAGMDVSDVVVTCADATSGLFNLRVNLVSYVSGTVLVSTNTGASNSPLSFTTSGTQTFTPAVANGTAYTVTAAAPVGQTCSVTNGSGSIQGADATVRVDCNPSSATPPPTLAALAPVRGAYPPIGGTGLPGHSITVTDGAVLLCATTVAPNGTWACTPGVAAPTPGNHSISATQTNPASGVVSTSVSTPLLVLTITITGPTTNGTGMATMTLTGGGPTCGLDPTVSGFIAAPVNAPATLVFPHGVVHYVARGCVVGSTLTLTTTWPADVSGMPTWKYGPISAGAPDSWHQVSGASGAGNTVIVTSTDGDQGDQDHAADGTVVDPFGPALSSPATAAPIPTLHPSMLALLLLLLLGLGSAALRRPQVSARP